MQTFYKHRQFAFLAIVVLTLVSCKTVTTKVQHLHDTSPFRATNEEYQYAGYELIWPNADNEENAVDDEFAEEFEADFAEQISARMPNIFKGDRPVKLIVTVLEVSDPGGMERFLFRNPSFEFELTIADASSGEEISSYGNKVTDYAPIAPPPPPGGSSIAFRIGSNASRLANQTANQIVETVRKL